MGILHLYRFIEDAWSGGLGAWCARDAGSRRWILVENRGQERWLARKFARAGISGIRVLDAEELRTELALAAGIPPPPAAAAVNFAVRVAAGTGESARTAQALAGACDDLARAAWHTSQLGLETSTARRLHRTLEQNALLPGFLDRRLRETLPEQPLRLCCVGWDAVRWPDLALIEVAAAKFASFEMFVPSPRLPADAVQREWIETLERRLELERVTCPESGFVSGNDALVARLENSDLASHAEAQAPDLLVGREWPDQVRLVCAKVRGWLDAAPGTDAPVGIVAPEDSPAAIAVAEALRAAGVMVESAGRARELAPALLILEQTACYHLGGADLVDLLELTRLLWLHGREDWAAIEPEPARDALKRAFKIAQSRNARILSRAMPARQDRCWRGICDLIEGLGRWEEAVNAAALRGKWDALVSALRLPPEAATSAWPGDFFKGGKIPGRIFMEWLADHIAAERRSARPPERQSGAPVVVATFAGAARQTWDRLIFLDSNEHVWPLGIAENPFLPDAARARLNRTREAGHLLTARELNLLEQSRFLDIVEHCRNPVCFAGVLLEQTEAGESAQPNEWVLRALIESSLDGAFPTDQWAASAQAFPAAAATELEPAERKHLEIVHGSRHNATMPFDRYQFSFHESKIEFGAWSATALDKAIACPATFALEQIFDAEATVDWTPARSEGMAVGSRAHKWLRRIIGLSDHLSPTAPARSDAERLAAQLGEARSELETWYGAEGLPLPIWWETCLRKTAWATGRCLREVRASLDGGFSAMEQTLAVSVRTAAGPLPLKGRIDLLISDRAELAGARVRMFDFKTGRGGTPTVSTLQSGEGAQFAAYYLMARDAGAAEAMIGIIKPEARAEEVFANGDEPALRAHFALLAELWRNKRFGRRGPLFDEYKTCETLPLATVPIDPAILEQKAGLFLLA